MDLRKLVLYWMCLGARTHLMRATLLLRVPFDCDGADYCNLGEADQYCTSGPNPRCANCWEEDRHCFTENMPTNCTLYCKAQYKEAVLKEAKAQYKEAVLKEAKGSACPALGNVTDGSHNASMSPLPGEVIQITCDEGYRVQGDGIVECRQYGQWSQELPTCEEIVCHKPMVAYGEVMWPSGEATRVGGYLSYRCAEGYAPASTESQAVCLSNGTWQSLACHKVKALAIIEDSTKGTVWMILAIFAITVAVLLTIALACVCCGGRNKLRNLCSNLRSNLRSKRRKVIQGYTRASSFDEPSSNRATTTPSSDPDQTFKMEVENRQPNGHIKMDRKQQSKPVSPRHTHAEPSGPRYASSTDFHRRSDSSDNSLPSVASSGASSTDPKKEVQPEPVPSSSSGPSMREEGPQSGGGEPAQSNYKVSLPGNINLNFNISNLNNNHNNDHSCHNHNNTAPPDDKNTPRKEDVAEKTPDKTPYPTQATQDTTKGGNSQGTDSEDGNTAGAGIHAQPVDNSSKLGKVALKNNDVAFSDLKRKRTHSPSSS